MEDVNAGQPRRRYHSPRRAAQAAQTRQAILTAARDLLAESGYPAMTVAQVARRAGVAVDTVYSSVGRKPQLLHALAETALSGTDAAVPAAERDYVQQIRAATAARDKIGIYAQAVARIQLRLAPVFLALGDAAATDPATTELWDDLTDRRARDIHRFAANLRATGELRGDLSDDEVADVIWSMAAAEYWVLLVHRRGWTPDRFARWLTDAWARLLLAP
ncbi:TetR/AcrR family transcriptional regulator [Amycolatopsis viridis]|uniref:AcrR family transcriptional regulator n=1 Tax=Amycolatopsis viridis TaxID=185678 RepID=A0ABX0SPS3_9PSEU|nr:helix-turn-helix domain-containing protein [Amycolatopsis viridis]NIH77932.1 AcrR family transcriptional regulator [Amycolatopsis viridis]